MKQDFDVIIIGAGIPGSLLALMLAKNNLRVLLCDKNRFSSQKREPFERRVSAIAQSSVQAFKRVNAWEKIKLKASPYREMLVWDAHEKSEIHFKANDIAEPQLGFILENTVMQEALLEQITQNTNIHYQAPFESVNFERETSEVRLYAGHTKKPFTAKLLVGADGAQSWVREQLQLSGKENSYDQHALVTTIQTEKPHGKIARQIFLETGPLAFLPLSDPHYCSIVWSTSPAQAARLMKADSFNAELTEKIKAHLGEIQWSDERLSFPLKAFHIETYTQERVAFIGDAAHTLHPLAGLGMNLGILDAVKLAETIAYAHQKERDIGLQTNLARFARERELHNGVMILAMSLLKKSFSGQKGFMTSFTNFMLNQTNQLPFLKSFFMSQAMGSRALFLTKNT